MDLPNAKHEHSGTTAQTVDKLEPFDLTIDSFREEFAFLSNFAKGVVFYDGDSYPTLEHAYQAAKTLDKDARREVAKCKTPGQAKRLGKLVKLRDNWHEHSLLVMEVLLKQKFAQEPFRQQLLDTGDAKLIEGNNWGDRFWGVCRGKGQNHLGRLLMKVRQELREDMLGLVLDNEDKDE